MCFYEFKANSHITIPFCAPCTQIDVMEIKCIQPSTENIELYFKTKFIILGICDNVAIKISEIK